MNNGLDNLWNISLDEAKGLQKRLATNIEIQKLPKTINRVAGFDVTYLIEENLLIAGMVIFDYPSLDLLDKFVVTDKINFPYIPGYLSFREAPILLTLIEKYHLLADIFIFDGHGIAHPRGLGIASHIGVLINKPCIGCAKKKLVGEYKNPGESRGDISDLIYKNKIVGHVLRTKHRVKPVFISVGNLVNLPEATKFVLTCTGKYRLPEPTRIAHQTVGEQRKKYKSVLT